MTLRPRPIPRDPTPRPPQPSWSFPPEIVGLGLRPDGTEPTWRETLRALVSRRSCEAPR